MQGSTNGVSSPANSKSATPRMIRVLILEDCASDAELMVRELRRSGFDPTWERVDTEGAYWEQLATVPDVVLADYRLPGFDAPRALEVLRRSHLDIPFIVVSGAIGEEIAVSMMRGGASDYLLKDRLARLGPAVRRALEDKRLRADKQQAASALESSEIRFHSFMNNSPTLAFIKDEEGRMLYVNNTCERMWDVRREECIGKLDHELWPIHTAERLRLHDSAVLGDNLPSRVIDDLRLRDGRLLQLLSFRFVMHVAAGRRMLGVVAVDIGEQLRAQRALTKALEAKETLLREVHHRVKNNLQVISSLLNMQAAGLQDPAALSALDDIQKRVRAIALIHELLHNDDSMDRVAFSDYVTTLTNDLFYSRDVDRERIRLQLDLQPVLLDLNQAIPCGLILNELLTNALKYAFPDGRRGEIGVSVGNGEDGEVRMTVADDGVGLPDGFDAVRVGSLGLQIVDILVNQIDGTVERGGSVKGARFTVTWRRG